MKIKEYRDALREQDTACAKAMLHFICPILFGGKKAVQERLETVCLYAAEDLASYRSLVALTRKYLKKPEETCVEVYTERNGWEREAWSVGLVVTEQNKVAIARFKGAVSALDSTYTYLNSGGIFRGGPKFIQTDKKRYSFGVPILLSEAEEREYAADRCSSGYMSRFVLSELSAVQLDAVTSRLSEAEDPDDVLYKMRWIRGE